MPFKNLVSVAGYDLPEPSSYVGTESTVVDASRNVLGYVVGAVVRESVGKVEMGFKYITATDWSNVMKLFNSEYGGNFYNSVEFFNQLTNDWTTRTMYVGDRTTSGAYTLDPNTGKIVGYTGAKISLIEV